MNPIATPTAAAAAVPPEPWKPASRTPCLAPLADITGAIVSARTAIRNGRRGVEVTVEGAARLRADARPAPVSSVVFLPATAPDEETHDLLARELATLASLHFAIAGRIVPADRISVVLR